MNMCTVNSGSTDENNNNSIKTEGKKCSMKTCTTENTFLSLNSRAFLIYLFKFFYGFVPRLSDL